MFGSGEVDMAVSNLTKHVWSDFTGDQSYAAEKCCLLNEIKQFIVDRIKYWIEFFAYLLLLYFSK